MNWLDLLQWPAMASTVAASWFVTCQSPGKRKAGFWTFLLSNVLWCAWGVHSGAPALVVLQACLAALNIRGVAKARAAEAAGDEAEGSDAPEDKAPCGAAIDGSTKPETAHRAKHALPRQPAAPRQPRAGARMRSGRRRRPA